MNRHSNNLPLFSRIPKSYVWTCKRCSLCLASTSYSTSATSTKAPSSTSSLPWKDTIRIPPRLRIFGQKEFEIAAKLAENDRWMAEDTRFITHAYYAAVDPPSHIEETLKKMFNRPLEDGGENKKKGTMFEILGRHKCWVLWFVMKMWNPRRGRRLNERAVRYLVLPPDSEGSLPQILIHFPSLQVLATSYLLTPSRFIIQPRFWPTHDPCTTTLRLTVPLATSSSSILNAFPYLAPGLKVERKEIKREPKGFEGDNIKRREIVFLRLRNHAEMKKFLLHGLQSEESKEQNWRAIPIGTENLIREMLEKEEMKLAAEKMKVEGTNNITHKIDWSFEGEANGRSDPLAVEYRWSLLEEIEKEDRERGGQNSTPWIIDYDADIGVQDYQEDSHDDVVVSLGNNRKGQLKVDEFNRPENFDSDEIGKRMGKRRGMENNGGGRVKDSKNFKVPITVEKVGSDLLSDESLKLFANSDTKISEDSEKMFSQDSIRSRDPNHRHKIFPRHRKSDPLYGSSFSNFSNLTLENDYVGVSEEGYRIGAPSLNPVESKTRDKKVKGNNQGRKAKEDSEAVEEGPVVYTRESVRRIERLGLLNEILENPKEENKPATEGRVHRRTVGGMRGKRLRKDEREGKGKGNKLIHDQSRQYNGGKGKGTQFDWLERVWG